MFIGITGTLYSGMSDIAKFLIQHHDFKLLALETGHYELSQDMQHLKLIDELEPSSTSIDEKDLGLPVYETFKTNDDLVNYATANWLQNFVIVSMKDMKLVDMLLKRPFFVLISVDSSLLTRFNRYSAQQKKEQKEQTVTASSSDNDTIINLTLHEFLSQTEPLKHANDAELLKIMDKSHLKILNETTTPEQFHLNISQLQLLNKERLRPSWDTYFMSLADLAAHRSNCMKRRVGCVVVRNHRVVATGYNGTPRGTRNCNEGGCPRCNSAISSGNGNGVSSVMGSGVGLSTCLCLHAEENALLEAGRDRVEGDSILYCNTCPCLTCTIKIVQSGVKEVVYSQSYSMDEFSSKVFKEAGVVLRQFTPPQYGVVVLQ
ncbi:unnamed protein product [Ambrosiozyma monospora]|uniref:Deoxycytidylate deaminase n=1 Tax=Ambrosiozyma monospora TaxID=43982 RepID=A0A9W6YUJ4_AMBMO|nr:unnamed protein product [Ambrosiozyma monospora]